MDRIFLALLQEGWRIFVPYVVKILLACLVAGYIPAIWHQVKFVFIHKPNKNSYSGPRDFKLISLTLFLFKTMDRLVDRFLGMKFWLLWHYIIINMHTRLENLWKQPFISSWFGWRRCLTCKRQLWVFS